MNTPVPPMNLDAEESVIGAAMLSSHAIDAALDSGLAAEHFYRKSHGIIWRAILELYANDEPVDAITLVDKLDRTSALEAAGGAERIHELSALVPAASNAAHYARIVSEMSTLRGLVRAGNDISMLGFDRPGDTANLVERAEKIMLDLASSRQHNDFVAVKEPLMETFKRIDELQRSGQTVTGLTSGFGTIDAITSGFQRGNLVIVAARPSMGKSGLALNIATNASVSLGLPVGLFTLEMSKAEVTERMLSSEALVDSKKIRNGQLGGEEWERVTAAAAKIHDAPLYIDDSGSLTVMELRSRARRLKMRTPDLALIVVDYIQLMSGDGRERREQDVSVVSRTLKVLAGELRCPIIALSQLSREPEKRHDHRPILSDLRESGSIEQDADVVMFIYRDEYYHPDDTDQEGIAEVNIAKHRSGSTGTIKLAFVKRNVRFSDLHIP